MFISKFFFYVLVNPDVGHQIYFYVKSKKDLSKIEPENIAAVLKYKLIL